MAAVMDLGSCLIIFTPPLSRIVEDVNTTFLSEAAYWISDWSEFYSGPTM